MKIIIILVFIFSTLSANKIITPSEVYSEVKQIQKELILIKKYFKINKKIEIKKIKTALEPRHAWQKTYEIMIKLNILRVSNKMPKIEPSNMEAVLNLDPILTYEQTQRILTEIKIFKFRMNINKKVSKAKKYKNKKPLDVFNALQESSALLDLINGSKFTPSYVFGETLRIFDDITTILQYLNIKDHTIPTKRRIYSKPIDTFRAGMKILLKIQSLQNTVGIKSVDFYDFQKDIITPSDVFGLTQMILAELQTIKAYIGLQGFVTPTAMQYKYKSPADVDQMMGWSLRQISLIKTLNYKEQSK